MTAALDGPASGRPLIAGADGIGQQVAAGVAVVLVAIGGLGAWGGTASLGGAVIAQGVVTVDSNVKKVQHQGGGIVGEIRVKEGDRVGAGDLLLRLDETVARANLLVITRQLDEFAVRLARLKAERDAARAVTFPASLGARAHEAEIQETFAGEVTLFESRRKGRLGQQAQLRERIQQYGEEIRGIAAQAKAKAREVSLIERELAGVEELFEKKLVALTRLTQLQREAARLGGERGQLLAASAQASGKIAEAELQVLQLDQDARTEVIKEMRDIQGKEGELLERRIAAEDQLRRVDVRAPLAGLVHQLAVHTVGGVVAPGEPVMLIVPQDDELVIEARVAPQDIDHVKLGAEAFVRFSAFNQRTTPEFTGILRRVSADLTKEPGTNQAYYTARISVPEAELGRAGSLQLLPGMPAEVHIKTSDRLAVTYFLKPLQDQIARTFRDP